MQRRLKQELVRVGLGPAARRVARAIEPASTSRDRRDQEHMRSILAAVLAPDSCCVDVGANQGDVLAEMCRLAPRGRHVAFEPLPLMQQRLRARCPAADVRPVALGGEAGTASFVHVVDHPGWSGFRERPHPGGGAHEHLTVEVQRLDDALTDAHAPALIKIDVEGAELGVLEGAERTLRAHHPVLLLEHGLGSADYYGTRPEQVFDRLDALGYRLLGLDGEGPFSRAAFIEMFGTGARVNFLARV